MLGALLPSYQLTHGQEGVLGLTQAAGLVIASLSAGPVIDLRGNKLALLLGLFLVAASLFAAPVITACWWSISCSDWAAALW